MSPAPSLALSIRHLDLAAALALRYPSLSALPLPSLSDIRHCRALPLPFTVLSLVDTLVPASALLLSLIGTLFHLVAVHFTPPSGMKHVLVLSTFRDGCALVDLVIQFGGWFCDWWCWIALLWLRSVGPPLFEWCVLWVERGSQVLSDSGSALPCVGVAARFRSKLPCLLLAMHWSPIGKLHCFGVGILRSQPSDYGYRVAMRAMHGREIFPMFEWLDVVLKMLCFEVCISGLRTEGNLLSLLCYPVVAWCHPQPPRKLRCP